MKTVSNRHHWFASSDAAIGSFAASNACNVYLGLGIPWTIMCVYDLIVNDKHFFIGTQETGDITWGLVMLMSASIICFAILLIRRYKFKGELGAIQKDRTLILNPKDKYDPNAGYREDKETKEMIEIYEGN
jgi:hypothetical protein